MSDCSYILYCGNRFFDIVNVEENTRHSFCHSDFRRLTPQDLGQWLDELKLARGRLTLACPTSLLSVRRLSFPFSNRKKIITALQYSLSDELVDDVDEYQYTYEVLGKKNKSDVLAYILRKDWLNSVVEQLALRGLTCVRATPSVQLLKEAHYNQSFEQQVVVYLGVDEVYFALIEAGHVMRLRSFSYWFQPPQELISTAEASKSAEQPSEDYYSFYGDELEESNSAAGLEQIVDKSVQDKIAIISRELQQFMKLGGLNEGVRISLKGWFSQYVRWNATDECLEVAESKRTSSLTLLEEVSTMNKNVFVGSQMSFIKTVGLISLQGLRRYQKSLAVTASLLVMLAGLWSVDYVFKLKRLQAELLVANNQLTQLLNRVAPDAVSAEQAIEQIRQSIFELQDGDTAKSIEYNSYHYRILNALKELSSVWNSDELSIDSIDINSQIITLAGLTNSYDFLETLKTKLESLDYFSEYKVNLTQQRSGDNINYRIVIAEKSSDV